MSGSTIIARRARDPRPPSISFPASANRNASMSDAHEILQVLRTIPKDMLAYEGRPKLHVLQARTGAGLYEADVVVEIAHHDGLLTFDPDALRNMVVRTLQHAFPEGGCSADEPIDQRDLLASLGTLAGLRERDVAGVDGLSAICSAPTPWCDMGVRLARTPTCAPVHALSQRRREAWSALLRPALAITDRTESDASLAIAMRPDSVMVNLLPCPMARLRLERDLAPLLAAIGDEDAR